MLVIRQALEKDVYDLLELAHLAGKGMTSLPTHQPTMEKKIRQSMESFSRTASDENDMFFLVMEDTQINSVVGTASIYAHTGVSQAFYAYRLMTLTHHSHSLSKNVNSDILLLTNDYSGCSEVASLFVHPDYRGNGAWLAASRYVLMGLFPHRFAEDVIAEVRGVTNKHGESPVWNAIGKHFFQMSFEEADSLCGVCSNQFITELMPKHPIYTQLLPKTASNALGKPHHSSKKALKFLENEGYHYEKVVDIFDGGPILRAKISSLKSVQGLRTLRPERCEFENNLTTNAIVANTTLHDFRAIKTQTSFEKKSLKINTSALDHLHTNQNDALCALPL